MNAMYVVLTFIGMFALVASLQPTYDICNRDKHLGWRVLFFLIVLFILGYGGFAYFQLTNSIVEIIDVTMSFILFGGGAFVLIVSLLSQRSIQELEQSVIDERYNALHDSLTGLANRKNLIEFMDSSVSKSSPFSLLSIDLNNFKQVNDALGHYYGDQLLVAVSERFNEVLPSDVFVSRMGGDEFALVMNTVDGADVIALVGLLHESFKVPFHITGYDVSVFLSLGVSSFPHHSSNTDVLLKQADIAMYESKNNHKNYVFYTDELDKGGSEKLILSSRIKKALDNEEFRLFYQPIVNGDGSIYGAEALIRWPQEDGSYISPEKFIGIAEQSVLIGKLSHWVINKAFSDLQIMKKKGFTGCLHVNLSAQDLQTNALYELASELIERDPLCIHQMIFEITENAMLKDLYAGKKMMLRLNEIGFKFSIDDFGTGFSSLSLLRDLPITQIKIDRSFVMNMTVSSVNHAIVKSTLFLAKNLHCSVVAEGVEDHQTGQELKNLECNHLQGYHFSRAVPLSSFVGSFVESTLLDTGVVSSAP
ncbi:putative bifunctional diguanylate cyclase/phosphodiesterase [Marinomonas sp. IMCC 4694]|uniref:putative bifunctional diguanylate cyclase/phosphodiesterase n=1 Tax=Marinomonas sp. IMCC 4694 TaxID=2605432 RepID=UPI0011E88C87|nr:bifunctional diguanylate cyclase/phosphodiesterase [Marinomonas sp. IMCC 4694]TYL47605.1 bifunctional diguanylate cyclase/phosphodiesterase [Marinomonas sp. IMCC 4694]